MLQVRLKAKKSTVITSPELNFLIEVSELNSMSEKSAHLIIELLSLTFIAKPTLGSTIKPILVKMIDKN
jgi:hypothetical protein